MRGYAAVYWSRSDPVAAAAAGQLRQAAEGAGYRIDVATDTSWIGVCGPNAPKAYGPAQGVRVIGEVYQHPDGRERTHDRTTDEAIAAWYSRNRWGRYVILFQDADGLLTSVFRDPSGALDAYLWARDGLQLVASDTPDWLMAQAAPEVAFDWTRIARLVDAPYDLGGAAPLLGIHQVPPGGLRAPGRSVSTIWRAVDVIGSGDLDRRTAAEQLRTRMDAVVSALVGRHQPALEISGGLDSAIVAAALKASGRPILLALNTRAGLSETDERDFAREVAVRQGWPLTDVQRPTFAYTPEAFERTAGSPWPSQNGRDITNDLAVAEACTDAGVDVLLTGKGGDALFFQMHTPLAFADHWRKRPLSALLSPQLPGVARWTRTSVWSVLRASGTALREAPPPLAPGKALQSDSIASGLAYYSACRRADVVDMLHPLMAQPLVEWALRTPVALLTWGGRERGFARAVFEDRLPPSIVRRRGKGDYAAYFNREVADNLAFLRSYLLEGRLAEKGAIDRTVMEARLQVDALRWQGGAPEILAAVSVEAWVRRWEERMHQRVGRATRR